MTDFVKAVKNLEDLFESGDVDRLQSECFSPDVMICGEGAPAIASGEASIREVLLYVMKETPNLSISVIESQPINESAVATWLQWSSPTEDGVIEFRSLTVWTKHEGKWKILSDMFGGGRF